MRGRGRLVVASVVLGALSPVTGCSSSPEPEAETSVGRADLESRVAGRYPPRNPRTEVDVACDGDLLAEVGAVQTCDVVVDDDPVEVRVTVGGVDDGEVAVGMVPLVPAAAVAQTLHDSLEEEGYDVDSVTCPDVLVGEVGESLACTAEPARGEGAVDARVTAVDGLKVVYRYELGDTS